MRQRLIDRKRPGFGWLKAIPLRDHVAITRRQLRLFVRQQLRVMAEPFVVGQRPRSHPMFAAEALPRWRRPEPVERVRACHETDPQAMLSLYQLQIGICKVDKRHVARAREGFADRGLGCRFIQRAHAKVGITCLHEDIVCPAFRQRRC